MTEQVDLDALITEVREWLHSHKHFHSAKRTHVRKLADALESTLAALSRAEETIEKAARLIERNEPWVAHTALTGYDKQKDAEK